MRKRPRGASTKGLNGKKWRSTILRKYRDLLEEFLVPEIPFEFLRDGSVFSKEAGYSTFITVGGKFRETDKSPSFIFPFYPELAQDYSSSVLRQRGMKVMVPPKEAAPGHVMAHEFYHYLEFLTYGPLSREQYTEEYRKKSEAKAEDFAFSYGSDMTEAEEHSK